MSESLCGICGIAAGRVISRSAAGIVAVPSQTARDGHVMVVSATHARSFADLAPPDADALMSLVGSATRAAEEASGVEKCYVLRIGDKQPHLHFHIVPAAEVDPPLAPHVFGDGGWSAGVAADALPPASVFDPVFATAMRHGAERTPANAARLPPWLVSLALSLLAFSATLAVAWPLIGAPLAGPVALFVGLTAMQAVDDRMKGVPVRWRHAIAFGATMAVVYYFLSRWLES